MILNLKQIRPININIEELKEILNINDEELPQYIEKYIAIRTLPNIWIRLNNKEEVHKMEKEARKIRYELFYPIIKDIPKTLLIEEATKKFKEKRPKAQPLEISPKIWLSLDHFEFDYLIQFDTNVGICNDTININTFVEKLIEYKFKLLDEKLGIII